MLDEIKAVLRENKTVYFWANLLRYWNNREFRNLVRGFEGPDIVFVHHLGKLYPEHLVYDIRIEENSGFFWELYLTLQYLAYADKMHLTPVVSWTKNKFYEEKNLVNGTANIFEYYFLPVSEVKEDDIQNCKNVIYSAPRQKLALTDNEWMREEYRNRRMLCKKLGSLYRKYIKLNLKARDFIDNNIKELLTGKGILGIHFRGTDFKKSFNSHPVYICARDFIKPAKELMRKWGYQQIFLATDSLEAVNLFQKEFGSSLIYYKDIMRSDGDVGLHCLENSRKYHHYLLGLEVLRDVYTLVACDSLLVGLSSVGLAAQYIKLAEGSKYKEVRILDYGVNHNYNHINL